MIPSSSQWRAHIPSPNVELEATSGSLEDYDDRNGYLSDFLCDGSDFIVPLPLLKDKSDLVQGGAEFYIPTVFDRGHMVRRLDPVWGVESTARRANADTHHYTNSCPQVHSFNDVTWGDLEDWILSQERSRDSKGSVSTGPIFQEFDPVYEGVKLPVEFL